MSFNFVKKGIVVFVGMMFAGQTNTMAEYSGETVPLILEESVPPNSGWI